MQIGCKAGGDHVIDDHSKSTEECEAGGRSFLTLTVGVVEYME